MAEDIFEESTITIEATLKEGGFFSGNYTGKLDLVYQKNDKEISKQANIEVPAGTISRTYKVPKVEGTEETYNLKVVAHYGKQKEKTRLLVDATVWPKTVKLTAKDVKDDSPAKKLAYEVKHTSLWFGATTAGNTDDNGVGNEDLKKSPYTIAIKAPWEIVTNKNDTHKREHDLTVRRNPKAKFVKPDLTLPCYIPAGEPSADKKLGVRQYVNMTTAAEGCDAKGSIVEFEVCNVNKDQGLTSDKIYIKVQFTRESLRNDPKPALLAPALSIVETNGGKTFTGYVNLATKGGTAKFNVQLGIAGGDMATITVGYSESDPSDDKIIITNWRKLGYQLRFAQMFEAKLVQRTRVDGSNYYDIPDSIFNVYKERLKKVFVEYENIKSHSFANPAATAPSMITKGFLEHTADTEVLYVLDGLQNWLTGATAFDAAADQREIHITLCESALSSNGTRENPKHKLTKLESIDYVNPAKPSQMFPKKTYTAADQVNITIAGFSWTADMAAVSETDKKPRPSFQATDATEDLGENIFSVSEPTVGGPALSVTLTPPNTLPPTELAKIKNYYAACFADAKKLRVAKNELKFVISGATGGDADAQRGTVASALQDIHANSTLAILYHPGLDDDGVARTGPMSDITIDHMSMYALKFILPTGGPNKPGDFVGDPSPTKCPINTEFAADGTGAINGNAGGGSQLMVLKTHSPGPCAATICHELGHSMGMTVMPQTGQWKYPTPPGLTTPLHVDNGGWYYRNQDAGPYTNGFRNLHKGGHCANGMPSSKKSHSTFDDWSPGASDDVCIMWGSGGVDDNRKKYCVDCTKVLKARRLEDVRAYWDGRTEG
jgi:hypothetical protein